MKASEVILRLQYLMERSGADPEVLAQSHGCCSHGHEIEYIDFDEVDNNEDIVIHV
jgi:hypothetical protein